MGKYQNIFKGIKNAKPMGGFLDKLPVGNYTLALKRYAPKTSAKNDNEIILESDWLVLESSVPEILGTTRGWAWFIDSRKNEHTAAYERDRANKFLGEVVKTFTQPGDIAALKSFVEQISGQGTVLDADSFGEIMAEDSQPMVGLRVRLEVTERADKKDASKKYQNANWIAIPQTLAQVAEFGAAMKQVEAKNAHPNAPNGSNVAPHAAGPAAAPAPAPASGPFQLGGTAAPAPAPAPTTTAAPNLAAQLAALIPGAR